MASSFGALFLAGGLGALGALLASAFQVTVVSGELVEYLDAQEAA